MVQSFAFESHECPEDCVFGRGEVFKWPNDKIEFRLRLFAKRCKMKKVVSTGRRI